MTASWNPTSEDAKRIRRQAAINLSIFVGVKVVTAVAVAVIVKRIVK